MPPFIRLLCTALIILFIMSPSLQANPLSGYQWKNRIIVMNVTTGKNTVKTALKKARPDILDRDLVIIDISPKSDGIKNTVRPSAASIKALRSRLSLSGSDNQFVLIGKDSGIKARQKGSLNLQKFFALIDTMPMRKQEMQRK